MLRRGLLLLAALTVAAAAAELYASWSGLDHRMMVRAMFLQGADLPVHRHSADPFLHYELKPGARRDLTFPGRPPYRVSIDEHGARFPTHLTAKPPGTFRILAFGGSTLYGATVNDEETIPAALERRLGAAGGGDGGAPAAVEVWNFGTSAYTLGQAAHLARQKLPALNPDLILVQHHNRGRRGFLMPESQRAEDLPPALLAADPHLYREQFHPPVLLPAALHGSALAHSAAYRATAAAAQSLLGLRWTCDYCERLSADQAGALDRDAAARGVPVVYFAIPADMGGLGPDTIYPGLDPDRFIDLHEPGRHADFYEVHPPAATLDELAAQLARALRARRFVPPWSATDRAQGSGGA